MVLMRSERLTSEQLENIQLWDENLVEEINEKWIKATRNLNKKIIVLDDDPTGIQTVHSLPVYTSWDYETLLKVFDEECNVVYILTNSRSFTLEKTEEVHIKLAQDLLKASKVKNKEFMLISRGDSTLRGHYPKETECLYNELRKSIEIHGEIIIPFFYEGNRFTINDIHYVKEKKELIPAGETEFAKDPTFGYRSSNLKKWVREKTLGKYPEEEVHSISLDMIKEERYDEILNILMQANNFRKVIVNATTYLDLKVFLIVLCEAIAKGKNYIFRTASSFVQIIGGIQQRPLLDYKTLIGENTVRNPGVIIVGSFTDKTTNQLSTLKELEDIDFIEWNVKNAVSEDLSKEETKRVICEAERSMEKGKDVCIYSSRDYYWNSKMKESSEDNLKFSLRVSKGLVDVVKGFSKTPGFIVAKGGITSSDIGVKGLGVKRAIALGQIQPGVPVWKVGGEGRFPNLNYVIFPGNVGEEDTLKKVIQVLRNEI